MNQSDGSTNSQVAWPKLVEHYSMGIHSSTKIKSENSLTRDNTCSAKQYLTGKMTIFDRCLILLLSIDYAPVPERIAPASLLPYRSTDSVRAVKQA